MDNIESAPVKPLINKHYFKHLIDSEIIKFDEQYGSLEEIDKLHKKFALICMNYIFHLNEAYIHAVYQFDNEDLFYGIFMKNDDMENFKNIMTVVHALKETWIGKRQKIVIKFMDLKFEEHLIKERSTKINFCFE